MKNSTLISAAILASISTTAFADNKFAIETDPYTFIQSGDSLHIKFSPDAAPNWRLGLGVYSLELPSFMVDLNSENDDKDWMVDLERGVGLFADYYFNTNQEGWYVGAQLSTQDYVVSAENSYAEYTNGLLMFSLGYRYPLFDSKKWYVQPWMGLGYTKTTSGKQDRLAAGYDVDPLVGFATLHVGYQF